ncbi:CBS domain-containing protein [Natronorarus salvus]|uniref:CBS domain-containing protein n=1 Tax=Natronorarus salvus TaxID=3117733 RepID=UPI002F263D3D
MVDEVTVRDVMTREFVGVSESDSVGEVIDVLLADGVSGVVVLRGREPVGMVTERDLLASLTSPSGTDTPIADAMSAGCPTVSPGDGLADAAATLSSEEMSHLLVMNGQEPVGVLTTQDVVAASASALSSLDHEHERDRERDREFDRENRGRGERSEDDTYSTQSVCEACGSLMPGLQTVNGESVCADCRGA